MNAVEEALRARIRAAGRVTFAEFMEAALYSPAGGYYTRPGRIDPEGDFFTSPSAHPAFGALLCVQLREMWTRLGEPDRFAVVEPAAGGGALERDIASYAARLDERFASALQYVTVDRVANAGAGGRRVLAAGLPFRGLVGCVLSNELLDAFPVHRFVIEGGAVKELYVTLRDGRFAETAGPPSTPAIVERLRGVAARLPEGCRGEVNLGLDAWAREVGSALSRGFALAIDFGHDAETLYRPERAGGTLRCYYRHTLNANPFQRVGRQDIAAHVDFTALDAAMNAAGVASLGRTTQREFLLRLGMNAMLQALAESCSSRYELNANRVAMLELIKPEGLGGFKVALYGKGVSGPPLTGLDPEASGEIGPGLPVPMLRDAGRRMPLLEGTYPGAALEFTATWEELMGPGGEATRE